MHCILLNITETLWKLWIGAKLDMKLKQQLEKASIDSISISLEHAQMKISFYLDHASHCIDNHFNSYKAAE